MTGKAQQAGQGAQPDLVTIGETMVAFARHQDGHYRAMSIGAESNVAVGFTQLGGRAMWVSRLGEDELGRLVARTLDDAGVVTRVAWSDEQPTGLAIKEIGERRTRVRYYRSTSAARELRPSDVPDLTDVRLLHLTGITPALSPSAAALVDAAVTTARHSGTQVSFDVNLRRPLWSDLDEARDSLLPLCAAADVVFIGSDEASDLVGTDDLDEIAARLDLRADAELVLKRGPSPASALSASGVETVPARPVEVVDVTGAGDAFAAGYLAATRRGENARTRLNWGHWNAARVIRRSEDLPPIPTRTELAQLGFDGSLTSSAKAPR